MKSAQVLSALQVNQMCCIHARPPLPDCTAVTITSLTWHCTRVLTCNLLSHCDVQEAAPSREHAEKLQSSLILLRTALAAMAMAADTAGDATAARVSSVS